jgi:hypothetical protein
VLAPAAVERPVPEREHQANKAAEIAAVQVGRHGAEPQEKLGHHPTAEEVAQGTSGGAALGGSAAKLRARVQDS